jgi:sugar phosphate isomerase/epimerase
MHLSCADFTWPSVSHDLALDLVRGIGFTAVDIGYFWGRSHIRPETVGDEVPLWAERVRERCESRGLAVADFFGQGPSFEALAVNHPDLTEQARSLEFFDSCVDFARRLGSPGLTVLPGVIFGEEPLGDALARAATGLRIRVERAGRAGLGLSVEPHIGSIIDTPALTHELLGRVPGLTLTVDYGHFVFAGIDQVDIEGLVNFARHVHCRGGAPGQLQAPMSRNQIDFTRMVRSLQAAGYVGCLAAEYVWSDWHRCNEVDNLTETVALFDLLTKSTADSEVDPTSRRTSTRFS